MDTSGCYMLHVPRQQTRVALPRSAHSQRAIPTYERPTRVGDAPPPRLTVGRAAINGPNEGSLRPGQTCVSAISTRCGERAR